MAQADNPKGFYPLNPNAKITYLPVAATQTLSCGDAIILSSGQVAIALANSATLAGVIAQDAVTLTQADLVACWIDPNEEFVGRMDGATSKVAGDAIDIIGATGAMMIDADAATTDVLVLKRALDPTESAATGQRWICKINIHAFNPKAAA